MEQGYYRFPTIHGDTVVFVSEGDLWSVPAAGGVARRLTSGPGAIDSPWFSPDGSMLAFVGRDEGKPEVYVMPADGGVARRLTFLGAQTRVVGWLPDGKSIAFSSDAAQPFSGWPLLYTVSVDGGEPQPLPTGPAVSASFGPDGEIVIGRNTTDLARWKRYRGGLAGDLWIDLEGDGGWQRLTRVPGNIAMPLWAADRVYFVADHEGTGNLYSCRPTGEDMRRHTHHTDYYVRHSSTDGRRIVYHAGGDLFLFDPVTNRSGNIAVEYHSSRPQRRRKFVDAEKYLQNYAIHPQGRAVAVVARGRPFTMGNWDGPAIQHGDFGSQRYGLTTWIDDKRLLVVSDSGGEETLEIHHADMSAPPDRLVDLDIGRPRQVLAAPDGSRVALTNHRYELVLVDLAGRSAQVLDSSRFQPLGGIAWSPDSRWLAYSIHTSHQTSIIRLCDVHSGETYDATKAVLRDVKPAFDPDGKYLYFLSFRDFRPVYDSMHFDLNFPQGMRPYLVTLKHDTPSPFTPAPASIAETATPAETESNKDEQKAENGGDKSEQNTDKAKKAPKPVQIDLEGITDRVLAFPVPVGTYGQIRGIKGKALFSSRPFDTDPGPDVFDSGPPKGKFKIEAYDFAERNRETVIDGVSGFAVSRDASTLIYHSGTRLRVLKAGAKPKDDGQPGPKSGWIDLKRLRVSVEPGAEWEQIFREAWRLQRDHFWTEDMSGVDWQAIYGRYLPLLKRVSTRGELSDLLWEMQGELGTSHAYEVGGDYPRQERYDVGLLAADLRYDADTDSYLIERIATGNQWSDKEGSPLSRPGVNIRVGDRLLAVNGRPVGRDLSPGALLVNQAGVEVLLTVAHGDETPRTVAVPTLRDETPARYREWVEHNRRTVHEATDGRVGYVHIPDMGPRGYAEFHRGYLAEVARDALIVDVRFNGGGHVSQLIVEKLARRRLGYDIQRWGQPESYPSDSVLGPIVAITNERAGSDGDIFSHVFKLLKIGPLIGKRTWGGVIGINGRNRLVDGGLTTQPEFSFWFNDVGWQVENYGTDPDIEVDFRPQDHAAGVDPQLDRALSEITRMLAENPPQIPTFGERPRLAAPALPDLPKLAD